MDFLPFADTLPTASYVVFIAPLGGGAMAPFYRRGEQGFEARKWLGWNANRALPDPKAVVLIPFSFFKGIQGYLPAKSEHYPISLHPHPYITNQPLHPNHFPLRALAHLYR